MACLIILPAAISSIFFFIAGITAFIRKHSQKSLIPASILAGAFSASVYVMVIKPYEFIGFIIAIITSIIALIIGDYKIDGSVRENELAQLCKKYKYSCSVIDDSNLKDGTTQWNPEAALEYIKSFVSENNISVIFTFDDKGVSGHPNHIGTHHAVKFASKTFDGVHVLYLQSFNLFCKYSSFLSVFQLLFRRHSAVSFSPLNVFANMRIHKSQFRVHIPFWSLFSSYSYINTYYTE
ncbi:N-acetylglucosaminylphosphatidylinositol deacetylase [Theileria orientalis]|uniref:N-acetylglucosaminylphosphatidylinositol deacetylase n=1 Tax=Theileria orientalis TaxID=68886 RepID=A0A976QXH6_THEOR|nr:N-acetylglucosaminylphosphatidylinositol deacetylase [Theileria orientalis]